MAARTLWKGYLKLSPVTCPVAMRQATGDGEKLRFHTLNARTGNLVVRRSVDAESRKPVDEDDEVRGYPTLSLSGTAAATSSGSASHGRRRRSHDP